MELSGIAEAPRGRVSSDRILCQDRWGRNDTSSRIADKCFAKGQSTNLQLT